jgi:phospholipase/carboxylesterase
VSTIQRLSIAGLTTRITGPADARLTVVMMHGFGAPGDDLVALADTLELPVRFVFPEAPLELGGLYGDSRAWWLLDLAKLEAELRAGAPRDRRAEVPEGLAAARAQILRLLEHLQARFALTDRQLAIGGFSQGAMLALDVALHRATSPAALVVLSGTLIAEAEWQPLWSRLATVSVFQSHGRHDALLPFSVAEVLRDRLSGAGAQVDWHAFVGAHEIPPGVLGELRSFLARVVEA